MQESAWDLISVPSEDSFVLENIPEHCNTYDNVLDEKEALVGKVCSHNTR